ncbi:cyclin-like protein interacting with PHO85 [Thecaphora frezii]
MLPKSPRAAASSPGPASSQSSSAGSHYSSSASSVRQFAAPSDSSSAHTSPPTVVDRSGKYQLATASNSIQQAYGDAEASLRFWHQQQQPHSPLHHRQFSASAAQSYSQRPPRTLMQQSPERPSGPPSHHAIASTSHPALYDRSHAIPVHEGAWPSRSNSGSRPQAYASGDHMMADQAAAHAGVIHNFGTSPESSRGPLAKTRRTSPGGSRASAELQPAARSDIAASTSTSSLPHPPYATAAPRQMAPEGSAVGSAGLDRSMPEPYSTHSAAVPAPPHHQTFGHPWRAGMSQYQSPSSRGVSTAASAHSRLSPRSQPGDRAGRSPSATALGADGGTGASAAIAAAAARPPVQERAPAIAMPKMNLATFPPQDLLKVLATLLHEIATANDEFRPENGKDDGSRRSKSRNKDSQTSSSANLGASGDADPASSAGSHRGQPYSPGSHLSFSDARRPSITTAALGALATPSSTLCFHARNVPSISIESYLLRILKYCPTTNEVFLSLLVYFDRMSRMGTGAKPGANGDSEIAGEAAGLPRAAEMANRAGIPPSGSYKGGAEGRTEEIYTHPGIKGFAIDSYNVHRLVIAGVTVASKFFSDVFYTNSRYAKVGGLPVHELNQLELQFLLLNDFRLTIPLDEMQRYADQLLMYGSGRPENVSRIKEPSAFGQPSQAASSTISNMAAEATTTAEVQGASSQAAPAIAGAKGQSPVVSERRDRDALVGQRSGADASMHDVGMHDA